MRVAINNKWNWFIILFISFFISEAVYKFLIDESLKHIRIAGVVKFAAQILMLLIIIKNFKQNSSIIKLIGLLCIFFIIGQLSLPNAFQNIMHLEYLNNSLFILITLLFFYNINLTHEQKNKALTVYEAVVIINSIAIIIGLIFSITYFKTYNGLRFGYDGFIIKSSYASYFYLIAMFYFGHKCFVLKKANIIFFTIVATSAILTGTKANILAFILIIVFIIIKTQVYRNLRFWIGLLLVMMPLLFFYNLIVNYLITTSRVFEDIINKDGLTTLLFSFRNQILTEQLIPFISNNWSFGNYLFGGLGDIMVKSGLDFIDLFYFFGFIGASVYIYIYVKILKTFKFKFNFDFYFFIFILMLIAALGGNFFYNSSVAITFVALMFYFETSINESKHT